MQQRRGKRKYDVSEELRDSFGRGRENKVGEE